MDRNTPNVKLTVSNDGIVSLFVNSKKVEKWEGAKKAVVYTQYSLLPHDVDIVWSDMQGLNVPVFSIKSSFAVIRSLVLDNRFHVVFKED